MYECINTVNGHQSKLDLRVSLLQQKVNNNKTCRSNFIWQDTKYIFTVSIPIIGTSRKLSNRPKKCYFSRSRKTFKMSRNSFSSDHLDAQQQGNQKSLWRYSISPNKLSRFGAKYKNYRKWKRPKSFSPLKGCCLPNEKPYHSNL